MGDLGIALIAADNKRGVMPGKLAGAKDVPKSKAEMLRELGALIEEYSAFQRARSDLPQGDLRELSQDELEQIVAAFQEHVSLAKERPFRLH